MKYFILLIALFCYNNSYSQDLDSLLEFTKKAYSSYEVEKNDSLVTVFKSLLKKYPDNPQVYYYLAHVHSRAENSDASTIPTLTYKEVLQTSEYLEKVISLDPSYKSPLIILGPYAKIQSEWGSLALKYYYKNDLDSVKIALLEGKKRGAFKPYWLELAKLYLGACSKESILVTSGDYAFFSILYMQQIEKYRTDVHILDIGLSNADWYIEMLAERNLLGLPEPLPYKDIPQYKKWDTTLMSIYYTPADTMLRWTLPPTYYDNYQLRNSAFLLRVLQANKFKKDVYFVDVLPEEDILALYDHLQSLGVVYKVVPKIPTYVGPDNWEEYLSITDKAFFKSASQLISMNQIRLVLYHMSYHLLDVDKEKARLVFDKTESNFPEDRFPPNDLVKEWREKVMKGLNSD